MAAGVEAQFGQLQFTLCVQCQRPVGRGQLQFTQAQRLLIARGDNAQRGRAEFRQGRADLAMALEAGKHALGIDLSAERPAGQFGDEGLQIGCLQLGLHRPGRFSGQQFAQRGVQFQRCRAADRLAEFQLPAERAAQFALTTKIAICRGRGAPVEMGLQWIIGARRELAIEARIAQWRIQLEGFDAQGVGGGACLQHDPVNDDRRGAGGLDAQRLSLQILNLDCQRQRNIGQSERFGRGWRVLIWR